MSQSEGVKEKYTIKTL